MFAFSHQNMTFGHILFVLYLMLFITLHPISLFKYWKSGHCEALPAQTPNHRRDLEWSTVNNECQSSVVSISYMRKLLCSQEVKSEKSMQRSPRSLTFYCTDVIHKPLNKQQTETVLLKSSEEKRARKVQEWASRPKFSYMEGIES